jgi:hypothetical protein
VPEAPATIRTIDPAAQPREYARDYELGWRSGMRCTEGALGAADRRNVSHAWYDGYLDAAAGRAKWTWRATRLGGFASPEEYALAEMVRTVPWWTVEVRQAVSVTVRIQGFSAQAAYEQVTADGFQLPPESEWTRQPRTYAVFNEHGGKAGEVS